MNRRSGILLLAVAALTLSWARAAGAQAQPSGELVWALHVSISPSWFDSGENGGLITPFAVLYAMHDGVVRPMPGQKVGNSLAGSWTESPMAWSMHLSCGRGCASTMAIPVRLKSCAGSS